jgi:hypothetical protein
MEVKVTITRYISDEPQPGIVECQLLDAHGHVWTFVEKTAIPRCAVALDGKASYPQPGTISCLMISRRSDAGGGEIVRIDTSKPLGVETAKGVCQFDVVPESLIGEHK